MEMHISKKKIRKYEAKTKGASVAIVYIYTNVYYIYYIYIQR